MEQGFKKDFLFLACLTFGVFALLSLLSYSSFDPAPGAFQAWPVNETADNLMGRAGAWSAALALHVFGWPAYLLPLFLFHLALRIVRGQSSRPAREILLILAIMIVAGVFVSTLESLAGPARAGDTPRSPVIPGGLVGYLVARPGIPFFGEAGMLLFSFALLALLVRLAAGNSLSGLGTRLRSIPLPGWKNILPRQARRRARKPVKTAVEKIPAKAASPGPQIAKSDGSGAYNLPGLELLSEPDPEEIPKADIERYKKVIEETIADFGISASVVEVTRGPTVTLFELSLAPGIMPHRITALSDNLAMSLRAASVRVIAPLPRKSTVGLEVPNQEMSTVYLSQIVSGKEHAGHRSRLAIALGKDTAGKPLVADLRDMPHLLIAGATGSGKTVALNAMLISILLRATPEEVQFMMIDPKRVELASYDRIPHLVFPVISEPRDAIEGLKWMTREMDRRYELFRQSGARHIEAYNNRGEGPKMPCIVLVIDELADLITVARSEVESNIMRLTQMARAAGIHLIIATQRPSVNVITGVIKANLPSRIAFQVSSKVDSRTILDSIGAEKLLGRGDMLYLAPGAMHPVRAQGCFLGDQEIEAVCDSWKKQGTGAAFGIEVLRQSEREEKKQAEGGPSEDPLFDEAVTIVTTSGNASVSYLQRRLKIGFNRSARLIEEMEEQGIVGPQEEGKPRQVIR